MFYRALRPALYALPPERAHHLAFGALRAAHRTSPGTVTKLLSAQNTRPVQAMGLTFTHPIGLAAGFDKNAEGYEALLSAGFSFVEVGTLTGHAQPGNPQPRLFRLAADRALINRMGFNNEGSEAAAARLARTGARKPHGGILGINIGKSKKTPEEEAAADYALSATRLAPYADYLVANVSSPNTPGLRNLQAVEKLEPILQAIRQAAEQSAQREVPLLVKIAPDLADEDVDAVAELAGHLGLAGVIATNTTISRTGLRTGVQQVESIGAGGLSGAPVKARALEVTRRLRSRLGPGPTIIGVGGIETVEDAQARLAAGADLLQIYTAYIYGGPRLPRRLAEGLARA